MAVKKDTLFNMLFALFLICLVSGGVLGLIFNLTKEPIEKVKEAKQKKAIEEVLPSFQRLENKKIKSALESENDSLTFSIAYDADNHFVGAAIETFTDKGFGGKVRLMVGLLPDGTINKVSVLSHGETPGLGAKMTDPQFKDQFNDKNPASFTIKVKKDKGDVDAITAATISSRAFCDAVNRAIITFENNKGGF